MIKYAWCWLWCFLSCAVLAQPVLSDSAYVSLFTVAPGAELYSVFGHSAFRVADPEQGIDKVYNYGTFDFDEPGFYVKFCRGKLRYFLNVESAGDFIRGNIYDRRLIREQRFQLDSIQKQRFFNLLETNALEENKYYQYDFFYDNCATRIKDMVKEVFYHQIWLDSTKVERGKTMRQLLDPYLAHAPWTNLGMDLLLGIPSDKMASAENMTFLPDHLHDILGGTRLPEGGALVTTEKTIPQAGYLTPGVDRSTLFDRIWGSPFLVMCLVAVIGLLSMAHPRTERIFDVLFWLTLGLVGLLITFLWFFTDHSTTKTNLNLLWALPTHLFFAWGNRRSEWTDNYFIGAALAAGLMLLFWKWIPQEIPLAAMPIMALVVVKGLYRRKKGMIT